MKPALAESVAFFARLAATFENLCRFTIADVHIPGWNPLVHKRLLAAEDDAAVIAYGNRINAFE